MRVRSVSRWAAFAGVLALSGAAYAQTQINQTFNSQGPAPSFGPTSTVQSGDAPPNGSVAGAVQAIVVDPTLGANTIFIGSANGGVWVTNNGGTTWTPLTANQPSNSIASLSLDPTDPTGKTIAAGIGITSNGIWGPSSPGVQGRGGPLTGILYSTNGGTTWTDLGASSALSGESVIGVQVRGQTILAATFEEQNITGTTSGGGNAYGLYRSTNGGSTFTLVSGAGGSGLPAGAVTSLVADPTNSSKFYAAVTSPTTATSTSVYVSTNSGATWTAIFTSTTAISGGGTNIIGATGDQLVIKLAAGPGNSVAIAVADAGAGTFGPAQILTGLYLSQNSGGTWSQLGTPNSGTSNQAAVNLAVAIDPTNTSIVYLTGDASATAPNPTIAAFRVQGSTVTSLTDGSTGNGSTIHADSRAIVFTPAGNLLVSSDGGIYQRSNPESSSGVWTTLNTSTLSIREPYKVAFDANSKLLVVAGQDTGVAIQSAPTNPLYNAVQPADGVNATVNDKTLTGQSAIYTSFYNLGNGLTGGLTRLIINSNGTAASPTPFPGGVPITCGGVNCTTFVNGAANDFTAQFVLNRINPSLIAIAGQDVYITQDTLSGANGVSATTVNLTLTDLGTTGTCAPPANFSCVSTIAYGTRDNTNALIAGTFNNTLFLSTSASAGSLTQLTAYPGNSPSSLVFDPRSSARFFVADNSNLYGTTNTGTSFTNLTANLPSGFVLPTAVEFISNNGVNALLVGGVNNYANAQSPITVANSNGSGNLSNWRPFGSGLPNVVIGELNYNPTVDVLAVGAVGAGDWVLYDVTSYFPQATVLQFGLANNNSTPNASFLTDGTDLSGNPFSRPLIKYGPGTLLIDGSATYSGTTTINGGIIQLGDGVNTGSLLGPGAVITTAGTTIDLQPGLSGPGAIIGNISGPGDLIQDGPGTFILLGTNTYSGGTTINAGVLQLGAGGATGSLTGNVLDSGTFAIDRSDTYTFGGVVSGGGAFEQVGTGTTIFTNTNTYTGGTTILVGTLQLGNGGTTGSIVGNVLDDSTFAIDRSNSYTFAGNISGLGAFQQLGTGTTVFTGTNTYAGPTMVSAGTLQAGVANTFSPFSATTVALGAALDLNNFNETIGSLAGTGNVTLGAGTLSTGGDGTGTTFSGAISGTGGLVKQGPGDFFLTGNSTYTGATNINGGILTVNGSILSPVFVNSGTALAGIGSVGPTTVNAGGTLAPGDAIGTLTVNGNLTFNVGSSYVVSVLGNTNDRTNATGAASLTGTVDAMFLSTNLQHSYTILSAAGGLAGTFTTLDALGLPSYITASLTYTATDADLTITSQVSKIPGLTLNQQALGGALDTSFNNGGGTLPGLFNLPAGQFSAALNALSGEGTSGTQETAFGAADVFLSIMMDQGAFWRSDSTVDPIGVTYSPSALGYAPEKSEPTVFKAFPPTAFDQRWRAWSTGFDSTWRLSGDPVVVGSATLSHQNGGAAAGLDYQFNRNILGGFAMGGSSALFSVPDRATSGSEQIAHLGTYGVANWGTFYTAGALGLSAIDNKTNRTIAAGFSPTETATGRFGSALLNGRLELGSEHRFGSVAITPFAAVQFAELWQAGFTETSTTSMGAPGILGLTYASKAIPSLPTFVGAQIDAHLTTPNGTIISPYARVSWVHEFEPTRDITATFITLPLATFTVDGPSAASNAARIDTGVKVAIAKHAWLFAGFLGEFARTSQMYDGKGGIQITW